MTARPTLKAWQSMQPRDRDKVVAEIVFGAEVYLQESSYSGDFYVFRFPVGKKETDVTWQPSRDLGAAWDIVEKLSTEAYDFYLSGVSPHQAGWCVVFDHGEQGDYRDKASSRADTPALAICEAALRARGVLE